MKWSRIYHDDPERKREVISRAEAIDKTEGRGAYKKGTIKEIEKLGKPQELPTDCAVYYYEEEK